MFIEGADLPDSVVVESDICIVGAGAAGITMALELSGAPMRVAIVEAGGFEYPEDGQEAYQGSQSGVRYADLDAARLRFFGGTTNHWGGYCRPLEPIDFEARDWIPHSGWPITLDDIKPYWNRAADIIQLDRNLFDGAHWTDQSGLPALDVDPSRFRTSATLVRPTHFGEMYRDSVESARNVSCYLNASVVDLVIGEHDNLIREVVVVNAAGNRSRFQAKHFVLACGGLETPRMMLNADKVRPNGIGNDHDIVGRYFMDHRVSFPGRVVLSSDRTNLNYYRFNRMPSGQMVEGSLHMTEDLVRAERLCGVQMAMEPAAEVRSAGDVSLTKLREGVTRFLSGGGWMRDFGDHVSNVFHDIDHVAGNLSRRITGSRDLSEWLIKMEVEQTPNPSSRVKLNGERDRLGLRRIDLHWETREIERHTVVRSLELLGAELGRKGIGRVRVEMEDDPNVWSRFDTYGYHQAGTTRMSSRPENGVVDGNCRVHGVGNLYVVGNSVFTTVGTCNPTFTITALSVRLAHHLREKMR